MTTVIDAGPGVSTLEQAFGDPWDVGNPTGFAELLAADERQQMPVAGEVMLDEYRLNAEFVPVEHGGRFTRMDRFTQIMRAVWRHDACLGLGYGLASFIAAANVWTAGSAEQRRRLTNMLLCGRKVSSVYHELAHGNDFSHAEFAATPQGDGWLLNGRKEVVTNLVRSHAMVLFARTDPRPGSRSHSQFFVPKEGIPDDALRYLPRFRSCGMRGVPLGGADFIDCPVGPDALVGEVGQGIETALSSFQLTRSGIPAMVAGCLDTGLRTALYCATERRLYGDRVIALPYVRAVLADAFADLLIVDAFCTTVARALHLRPEETGVFASTVKCFGSRLLMDAMDGLGTVLGAQSYLRDGRYAIFQKMARDLPTAGFGHASRAACRVTVLPQLPRLARRAWLRGVPADGQLFRLGAELPPLRFDRLVAGGPGTDGLAATLVDLGGRQLGARLDQLTAPLLAELRHLREECGRLGPTDLTIDASPEAAALVDRYAAVLAAASCLGIWWHNQDDPFAGDDLWVAAALHRLTERLGLPPALSEAQVVAIQEALLHEALARHESRRAFDLSNRTLPG